MLKLIVTDDFIDIIFNLPNPCINKVLGNVVSFEDVSVEEAVRSEKLLLTKIYEKIKQLKGGE